MAAASGSLHEPEDKLSPESIDRHRAIMSLMEEMEAVDWYDQRVQATTDETLRAILAHNRDEEKEHAAMAIEWLRRNDAGFDAKLREKLFTEGPIHHEGGEESAEAPGASAPDGSLGIGSLKEAP